jgi:hypothetical protein
MAETVYDPEAEKTLLDDWTDDLAEAAEVLGLPALTIVDATVTADSGAVVMYETYIDTGVLFKLDLSGVQGLGTITTKTEVTLSNGDTDFRRHTIEVRPT